MAFVPPHDDQPTPLSFVPAGEKVYIHGIHAGRRLRRRLLELGLLPGTCVRVMQRGMGGPVIIAINEDSRLALGACMSQKIFVASEPPPAHQACATMPVSMTATSNDEEQTTIPIIV